MFNYYTYEKLLKQYLKKQSEQKKEDKQQAARKKKNNQLFVNYNRRINKFVLEMVKNPLIIKDYSSKAKNLRKELMDEIPFGMENQKKFVFKKFVTDRERVNAYLEEQKKNHEEYDLAIVKKQKYNLSRIRDSSNDNNITMTPSNANGNGNTNANAKINRYSISNSNKLFKKSNSALRFIHSSKNRLYNEYSHHTKLNPYTKKSNQMPLLRDVSTTFKTTNERQIKTHFKAATAIAEGFNSQLYIDSYTNRDSFNSNGNGNTSNKMRLFSPIRTIDIQKASNYKQRAFSSKAIQKMEEKKLLKEQISNSALEQFKQRFPVKEENVDLIGANPLIFNIKFNEKSQHQNQSIHSPCSMPKDEKLTYLLRLITKNQAPKVIHNKSNKTNEMIMGRKGKVKKTSIADHTLSLNIEEEDELMQGNLSDYSKDDKIYFENELISLSRMDYIASKILKNCNYINKKSKYNDSSLKKGNGKLMITAGMTVNDFTKKYHIN